MAQAKQLEISLVISDLTTFSRFDLKENEIRLMLIFDVISNDICQFISSDRSFYSDDSLLYIVQLF